MPPVPGVCFSIPVRHGEDPLLANDLAVHWRLARFRWFRRPSHLLAHLGPGPGAAAASSGLHYLVPCLPSSFEGPSQVSQYAMTLIWSCICSGVLLVSV